MIVTRAVAEGSLNDDVSKQFIAQPQSIMIAGVIVAVLMLVPGMPKLQMILLAILLVGGGFMLSRRMQDMAQMEELELAGPAGGLAAGGMAEEETVSEEDYYRDINNIYSLISVEPVEMEFGYSLIPLVDESSGGRMINRIVIFRRQYAQEMGLVIPSIRLRDSSSLNTNQYVIKIKGEEVAKGEILVDYYLALEPPNLSGEVDGIETVEPAYGIPSRWITPDNKEIAEIYGYTVIDPLSVMLTHLSETLRRHSYELVTRQEVVQLVENTKKNSPELVEEVVPALISYGGFQKVLVNLLREGIPIKDMETILETIADTVPNSRDIDTITENIRIALKRTITRRFSENGSMRVVTLDTELEKRMIASLTKSDQGTYMALSPDIMQRIIEQISEEMKKFHELAQDPIVLTSQVIRPYFYRLIEQFYPNVYVLSFNEIANSVQIQALGVIDG